MAFINTFTGNIVQGVTDIASAPTHMVKGAWGRDVNMFCEGVGGAFSGAAALASSGGSIAVAAAWETAIKEALDECERRAGADDRDKLERLDQLRRLYNDSVSVRTQFRLDRLPSIIQRAKRLGVKVPSQLSSHAHTTEHEEDTSVHDANKEEGESDISALLAAKGAQEVHEADSAALKPVSSRTNAV
ncbi:hypothetical protein AB1Y20_005751 [Prymnesium parvum]|uniref:Uncharacterized protein n=1 Tax=Prymnesium parvum TaxID=97485 RepID=A0AB34J3U8_PRYPA